MNKIIDPYQHLDPKYLKKGMTPPKGTITTVCSWCDKETTNIAWNCALCGNDLRDSPPVPRGQEPTALHQRVMERKAEAAVEDLETWGL